MSAESPDGTILYGFLRKFLVKLRDWVLFQQLMSGLDQLDTNILRALQGDGRLSNADLAKRVGLSASACLRRVQALERSGVIKGYRAVIDPDATGVGIVAYVGVGLTEHTKKAQKDFERVITATPEVRECHNVSGTIEYLLRVEAKDLAAYKNFHLEVLGNAPKMNSITTYIVMDTSKDERA